MILFAMGLGVAIGLYLDCVVRAWDIRDRVGISFSEAMWLLDQK